MSAPSDECWIFKVLNENELLISYEFSIRGIREHVIGTFESYPTYEELDKLR
jgi:hypothetical protein